MVEHIRCCAGAAVRGVALALDGVLLGLVLTLFAAALAATIGAPVTLANDEVAVGPAVAEMLLAVLVSAAYFAGSWRAAGATPGQRLLALSVVSVDRPSLSTGRSLLRWALLGGPLWFGPSLALWSPAVGAALWGVAMAWLAVLAVSVTRHPLRRGLHDRLSGSAVTARVVVAQWPAQDAACGRG